MISGTEFYGGQQTLSGSGTYSLQRQRLVMATPTASSMVLTLPDARLYTNTGGPVFYVLNRAPSYTLRVNDNGGGAVKTTATAGSCTIFFLLDNSTAAGAWAWAYDISTSGLDLVGGNT